MNVKNLPSLFKLSAFFRRFRNSCIRPFFYSHSMVKKCNRSQNNDRFTSRQKQTRLIWLVHWSVMLKLVKSHLISISQERNTKPHFQLTMVCLCFSSVSVDLWEISFPQGGCFFSLFENSFCCAVFFYIFYLKQINSPASSLWTAVDQLSLGFPLINFFLSLIDKICKQWFLSNQTRSGSFFKSQI